MLARLRRGLPIEVTLVAVLLAVVFLDDIFGTSFIQPYPKHLIFMSLLYSILALSLNFVTGYVGQVSLGHAAFFGCGAYISAVVTKLLGMSFWIALPTAAIITALIGIPLGLPALRVKGPFLVVVTYGFSEVMRFMAINIEVTGGPAGLPGIPSPFLWAPFDKIGATGKEMFIAMALAVALLIAAIMSRLEKSPIGLAFTTVKDDEIAAGAMGVSPAYYKLLAFVFSAMFAGLAGAIYAHYLGYVSPEIFASTESILILTMVVVGGVSSMKGAFTGATLIVLLPEVLKLVKEYLGLTFDPWAAMFGLLLIGIMRFRPQGAFGQASLFRR